MGIDDGVVKGLAAVDEEGEEETTLFCRTDWRDARVVLLTPVNGCLIRDTAFWSTLTAVTGLAVVTDVVTVTTEVAITLIGFDNR